MRYRGPKGAKRIEGTIHSINIYFLNAGTLLQGALYILTERENMRITHVRPHGQQRGEGYVGNIWKMTEKERGNQ